MLGRLPVDHNGVKSSPRIFLGGVVSWLDTLPALAFAVNDQNQIEHFNSRWLELRGTSLQLELSHWRVAVHPEDLQVFDAMLRANNEVEGATWEVRIQRKDSSFACIQLAQAKSPSPVRIFVGWDVSDLKSRTRSLEEKIKDYELIVHSSQDSIILKDTHNNLIFVNEGGAKFMGKPRSELEGRNLSDLLAGGYGESFAKRMFELDLEVIKSKKPILDLLAEGPRQDDKQGWLRLDKIPILAPTGEVERILVFTRDRTELKEAQQARVESEKRYKAIVEDQSELLCRFRQDGTITFTNSAYYRFFKNAREGMLGANQRPLLPADILDLALKVLPDKAEILEHSVILKNGEARWLQWTIRVLVNSDSQLTEYQAVGRDISSLKATEEKLRTYLLAAEASVDGIAICDPAGNFTFMNRAHSEMFGAASADYFIGKHWSVLYTESELELWTERFKLFTSTGRWRGEALGRRIDGKVFTQEVTLTAMPGGSIVCVCRDISDRKRNDAKLERTTKELLRSNSELEQFAYVASHDLQEPLRMISSFVDLLVEENVGRLSPASLKYMQFIHDGAGRMRSLIRDLLAYSRVGRIDTEVSEVACNDVLSAVCQNLATLVDTTQAKIHYSNLPTVYANTSKLIQLFQNIVENALKYKGDRVPEIQITATRQNGEWLFAISDNGIGFKKAYSERIFQIFQRLNPRQSGSGSGIGLAISKKIVEGFGGRIWADSIEGVGSTFYFTLPILSPNIS